MPRLHLREDLEAGPVREHEIEEQEVDGLLREAFEPLGRGRGFARHEPGLREDGSQDVADDRLVVEDENGGHCFQVAAGRETVNRAPRSPADVTVSVPPCA